MYAQNYQKVGLLTNYKVESMNPKAIEYQKGNGICDNLEYASCQWKINVVLSTNYLSKVLRPEVVIEIQTAQKKLTFNVRAPFSAIYAFLRGAPNKQIAKLDNLNLSKEIK